LVLILTSLRYVPIEVFEVEGGGEFGILLHSDNRGLRGMDIKRARPCGGFLLGTFNRGNARWSNTDHPILVGLSLYPALPIKVRG
jgi:hypothetical protein